MQMFIVHNRCSERLSTWKEPNSKRRHDYSCQSSGRESSFITLKGAGWMWSIFAGASQNFSDETMNCS